MRGVRVNLTPNSDSEPEATGHGAHQFHDRQVVYNQQDRKKAERQRQKKVLDDVDRETQEANSGLPYRAKNTSFEDAVARVQGMVRSGRSNLAQLKAEHDADARSLAGYKAAPPRPGTMAYERMKTIRDRFAIMGRALELESQFSFPDAGRTSTAVLSEVGWTDAARAAAAAARRIGKKVKRFVGKKPSAMVIGSKKASPYRTFDSKGRMVRAFGTPVQFRQHAKYYGPVHL